jgi:hypothetical protein
MKPVARNGVVIALALTWDGARWPVRSLPPKARAFLKGPTFRSPSAGKMAKLFAEDWVREIRICRVPRLKGGTEVLADSFQTPTARRIGFRMTKTVRFDDILGVIYRRSSE